MREPERAQEGAYGVFLRSVGRNMGKNENAAERILEGCETNWAK